MLRDLYFSCSGGSNATEGVASAAPSLRFSDENAWVEPAEIPGPLPHKDL